MCREFSCIVNKQGKVFWSKKTHSHENILKEFNLYDGSNNWAKIEIISDDIFNTPLYKWKFIIDEERKPEWLEDRHEKACRNQLKIWYKNHVFKNEMGIICKDIMTFHFGGKSKHYGSSTSRHCGSSTSEHYGSSYCIGKKENQRIFQLSILRELENENNIYTLNNNNVSFINETNRK